MARTKQTAIKKPYQRGKPAAKFSRGKTPKVFQGRGAGTKPYHASYAHLFAPVKRVKKYRPGTVALREIRRYQKVLSF